MDSVHWCWSPLHVHDFCQVLSSQQCLRKWKYIHITLYYSGGMASDKSIFTK